MYTVTFGSCFCCLGLWFCVFYCCFGDVFAGDESAMLEDMCVAVAELGTVTFQVCGRKNITKVI